MGDTYSAAVVAKYSQNDSAEERPYAGSADSKDIYDQVPETEETNL
jgi:hypothetical protein